MTRQIIQVRKFGTVLISRPAGLEAFRAIRPTLDSSQSVVVNFEGVSSVTSGWLDEFLMNLAEYFSGRVELLPTENASVRAMLPILAQERNDAAARPLQRAIDAMYLLP